MGKLLTATSLLVGAAVWLLLFVILGTSLDTAFIAAGSAFGAVLLAAVAVSTPGLSTVLDTPLSTAGLLLGIAVFVILEVVLSIPMWIAVVAGLGTIGLYSTIEAALRTSHAMAFDGDQSSARHPSNASPRATTANGHDRIAREPVGAH